MAPIVSDYCAQARDNDLILAGMDDGLYATTLPLARLRYALEQAGAADTSYGLPFREMGIVLTADQFDDLPRWTPLFREWLRQCGLQSAEPIEPLIVARSAGEFAAMVRAHPASDFLFPERYRSAVEDAAAPAHHLVDAPPSHFFLLARQSGERALPAGWPRRL